MCGIALTVGGSHQELVKMGTSIKHRGTHHDVTSPDDNLKVWISWLPIVNSNVHNQPFYKGKWVIWLNGYISNYKELVKKYDFDLYADSDTLVLAHMFDKFGTTKVHEFNGFFSIIAYNIETKALHTFTDRYGIKQLYRTIVDGKTYIASEVKALLQIIKPEFDPVAVEDWKYSLGVMTDHTIFKGIEKVPKLTFLKPSRIEISYEDAKTKLKELFNRAVQRNKTDLPCGVFLSGGIDSGMIAKHIEPDYCFSMDYQDDAFSEINNIKLNSTGVHMSLMCNDNLFNKYSHETIKALDDPKVGSCYTNFAITELASRYCKVMFSGAGGDEVFDGYTHRYDKNISDVIKRTSVSGPKYNISIKEYDWRFLEGILIVEDRIGGWHTIEVRYPLLDNDFVDFALSLPPAYRNNKRILKDISGLHEKVINGKKRGFSNPHLTNEEWSNFVIDEISRLYNCL